MHCTTYSSVGVMAMFSEGCWSWDEWAAGAREHAGECATVCRCASVGQGRQAGRQAESNAKRQKCIAYRARASQHVVITELQQCLLCV